MTKEEAIKDAVEFAERYNLEWTLNDSQAAVIGRRLWSNLREASRDELKAQFPRTEVWRSRAP